MNLYKIQKNKGFTIVEAMVAIFILTISITSLLNITTSSSSSARYTNGEITANYLLQEAIDSIRNSRDTIAFQQKDLGGGWDIFLNRYGFSNGSKCFSSNGCYLLTESFNASDSTGADVVECGSTCPSLNYNSSQTSSPFFYNYTSGIDSKFRRKVNMTQISPDELKVLAIVEWSSGTITKNRSLEVSLLNWQK